MQKYSLESKIWWTYIEGDLRELLKESVVLLNRVQTWDEKFHDYSFIVFPAAKAYEGFLKKLFLDLGFISQEDYFGRRFRIGKALNPALDRVRYKDESVYDKVKDFCQGEYLSKNLWETWRSCRNMLFHWFPNERNAIDYPEAKQRVEMVINTIDLAYKDCRIETSP